MAAREMLFDNSLDRPVAFGQSRAGILVRLLCMCFEGNVLCSGNSRKRLDRSEGRYDLCSVYAPCFLHLPALDSACGICLALSIIPIKSTMIL